MNEAMIDNLVGLIGRELKAAAPSPPLRVVRNVPQAEGTMDAATRFSHYRMIQQMTRRHRGLQILVDQATFGLTCLEKLPDDELAKLHADLHKALEYGAAGLSLEEAGMIQPREQWG